MWRPVERFQFSMRLCGLSGFHIIALGPIPGNAALAALMTHIHDSLTLNDSVASTAD